MNKLQESYYGIGHLADLSIQPENFRYVYQLQLATNLDQSVVEGPLFLNLSLNQAEETDKQGKDILFANQLTPCPEKDVLL